MKEGALTPLSFLLFFFTFNHIRGEFPLLLGLLTRDIFQTREGILSSLDEGLKLS